MFDYVKLKTKCPDCGSEVSGYQTKDLDCSLSEVNFWECTRFYSSCDKCHSWIEYEKVSDVSFDELLKTHFKLKEKE